MKNTLLMILVSSALLFQTQQAQAAPIRLTQRWSFQGNNPDPGLRLFTTAEFDDSGVSNVGTSKILIDRFSLRWTEYSFLIFSGIAAFSNPPTFNEPGSIFALYEDGAFQSLNNTRSSIVNETTGEAIGYKFIIGDDFHLFDARFSYRHTLAFSIFTVVPEPNSLLLLGASLIGFTSTRRGYLKA